MDSNDLRIAAEIGREYAEHELQEQSSEIGRLRAEITRLRERIESLNDLLSQVDEYCVAVCGHPMQVQVAEHVRAITLKRFKSCGED